MQYCDIAGIPGADTVYALLNRHSA